VAVIFVQQSLSLVHVPAFRLKVLPLISVLRNWLGIGVQHYGIISVRCPAAKLKAATVIVQNGQLVVIEQDFPQQEVHVVHDPHLSE
jgi:hypothetical protein